MAFADDLQAVSVDEALLDVSERVATAREQAEATGDAAPDRDFARELAEQMRDAIRQSTGCEGAY